MAERYIGLMSGTSADGIDATLVEWCDQQPRLISHLEIEHPAELRNDILALCQPGSDEINRLGQLDQRLGLAFADAALQLLQQSDTRAEQVTAIGSHGQTVRHQPPGSVNHPFTLQIGDPNLIASRTGITTVADFRRRDMAAGGEGAPLAPAFHRAAFFSDSERRLIANIGGIANITDLGGSREDVSGFDSGPGNGLMDGWIQRHRQLRYDRDGDWASSGSVQEDLLAELLRHPFLHQTPPKSTGREAFHLGWLDETLAVFTRPLRPEDVQATLLELTAVSLTRAIEAYAEHCDAIYVCGGGALNNALMTRLQQLNSGRRVGHSGQLGIAPQQVEGAAFAWLARQTLQGLAGNLPAVTGAREALVLGGIYPARGVVTYSNSK